MFARSRPRKRADSDRSGAGRTHAAAAAALHRCGAALGRCARLAGSSGQRRADHALRETDRPFPLRLSGDETPRATCASRTGSRKKPVYVAHHRRHDLRVTSRDRRDPRRHARRFPPTRRSRTLEGVAHRQLDLAEDDDFRYDVDRILRRARTLDASVGDRIAGDPTGRILRDAQARRLAAGLLDRAGPPVWGAAGRDLP